VYFSIRLKKIQPFPKIRKKISEQIEMGLTYDSFYVKFVLLNSPIIPYFKRDLQGCNESSENDKNAASL